MTQTLRRGLVVAAVVGAFMVGSAVRGDDGAIIWFSQRVVSQRGHPVRLAPHYDLAPGPLVVWFVRDEFNPETCLAVLSHQGTGQIYAPTAVHPRSCDPR